MEPITVAKNLAGLNLFLTRKCNLRCSYCFVDKSKAKHLPHSVCDQAVRFINACAENSEKRMHVGYIGGEPLINWELFKYVTHELKSMPRAVDIGFTTNGTLLDEEKIDFITENNLRMVFSFDGDVTAMNDRIMANGVPSYNYVKRGVELLLARQVPFLVQLTITPNNAGSLYANLIHLIGLGIRKFIFGFAVEMAWDEQTTRQLGENLLQTFSLYQQIYQKNLDINFKYIGDEIMSYMLVKAKKQRISQACPLGKDVFAVDVDGSIYPCQALINYPEWSIGHVSRGFQDARRTLVSSIRNDMIQPCSGCELKAFCRKCPRSNQMVNGDPFQMEGFSCLLGRTTFDLVDKFVRVMLQEKNPRFANEYGDLISQWNLQL